jgi:hypothetical protein
MFNVKHNLAYYNQQILFNKEGQFVETPVTGEQLRKYYEDYRTNPAYLEANPDDKISWGEHGGTNPDTECREGYVVVYRFHANDYACVTMYTAEMWIRYGMGEITGDTPDLDSFDSSSVSPLTKCNDGYTVIYSTGTGKYSCIQEYTAIEWTQQGIAEFHDVQSYLLERINDKETFLKIGEINYEFQEIENELEAEKLEMKKTYDKKYSSAITQSKEDERKALRDYRESSDMTKEEISRKIIYIRNQLESQQDDILREKVESLKNLENLYDQKVKDYASSHDFDQYIEIVWNSASSSFEAVARD